MTDEILYRVENRIAVITINRPERRNAINAAVRTGLFAAWRRFAQDDTAAVAILTGAGERAFCAGMDLTEAAGSGLGVPPRDFLPVLGDTIEMTKPTIAAVNGYAFAGGWLFAQMCDLCVASENATFAITEAKVGRGMAWAVPLIRMLPQRIALELMMTAEPMSAGRLYELGFVNRVTPPGGALAAALELAGKIVANAPLTVLAAKEMVRLAGEMGQSAALRSAYHLFHHVYASADALEGPRAFRDKRPPAWSGR